MVRLLSVILFSLLFPATAMAADQYYIGSSNGVDVLAKPGAGADVTGHLDRLTDVKIIQKKRAWWKVSTIRVSPKVSGWVPSGAVRKRYQRTAEKKASGSFFSGLSSFFHQDSNTQKTAVLGVRGLDEEGNAAKGKANLAGVEWMEKLDVPDADLATFVEQGRLNP
ncbi:MAG: hypothetical protein R8L58_07845 [Mariprofundaceae bacterium]